jgi:hypothetical protein
MTLLRFQFRCRFRLFVLVWALLGNLPAQAQGSPVPGAEYYARANGAQPPATAAAPAAVSQYTGTSNQGAYATGSSPLPGSSAVYRTAAATGKTGGGVYQALPISLDEAKLRIEELRNLVAVSRPQDIQDRVYAFCEWLVDTTEAHNRLSNVFSKQDSLKAQALAEKNTAQKFAHLKNEATLLKAEVLIKQNRVPEAIGPLVDIVANEPKGSAGVAAYQRLKDLGFSEAVADTPVTSSAPGEAKAGNTVVVSSVKAQVAARASKAQSGKKAIPSASVNAVRVH